MTLDDDNDVMQQRKCASPKCNKGKPKLFTPKYDWEIYCSLRCGSRERQARYRERQKAEATA